MTKEFIHESTQFLTVDDTGSTKQIQEVINANNKFAFDLYSQLNKSKKENIFYSPFSIFTALAMVYEGVKGQTAKEIKSVFHFPENDILRPNFATIYNKINKKNDLYELNVVNALWVQKDYKLLEEYLLIIKKYYDGKIMNLDFIGETEVSRQIINLFIEQQTANKIKNLISQGGINALTRLIFTNAVYFKGIWEQEFDKTNTCEQDFKVTSTKIIKTPMMRMSADEHLFNYIDIDGLQILELPYKENKISMLILLPKESINIIELNLTIEKLNELKGQMKKEKLDVIVLPKFELDIQYLMADILSSMGMPAVFSKEDADFSGVNREKNLWIDQIIHRAFVKVDEEGTEVAGATTVVCEGAAQRQIKIFNADHPFIFLIQEKDSGNILFLGRVVNPAK